MEFVKGKPKGTNPAIMGNPIDMYAANGSKKQSLWNTLSFSLRLILLSGSLSISLPSQKLFLLSGSSHSERYWVVSTVSVAI